MRKISLDPFSIASVSAAIVAMNEYREWLKESVDRLCEILAKEYALDMVANKYGYTEGGNITCYVEEIQNGYRVVAEGEPVFFLEYGTGPVADTGPKLGTPPVPTYPGSYSDTVGQGTYGAWVEGGKQGPYRWTTRPRAGMYYAFRAANEAVYRVAREVFGS